MKKILLCLALLPVYCFVYYSLDFLPLNFFGANVDYLSLQSLFFLTQGPSYWWYLVKIVINYVFVVPFVLLAYLLIKESNWLQQILVYSLVILVAPFVILFPEYIFFWKIYEGSNPNVFMQTTFGTFLFQPNLYYCTYYKLSVFLLGIISLYSIKYRV